MRAICASAALVRPRCDRRWLCALVVSLAWCVTAQTTNLLTFDAHETPGKGFTVVGAFPEEDGFVFSTVNPSRDSLFAAWNSGDSHYRGSAALISYTCCETVLSRTNGGPFDFLGMRYAGVQPFNSGTVSLLGYRGLQIVAQQTFLVATGGNFQTLTLTGFTNVNEVRWVGTPIQFDDVTVVSSSESVRPLIHNFSLDHFVRGDVSGLKVNKTNALESSTNLRDWTRVRSWLPVTTFEQVTDLKSDGVKFYRVREL
jgi:hypothetical protein